jgi:hypothetical protein
MVSYVNFEVRFGAIFLFQGYVATCVLIGVVQIYLTWMYLSGKDNVRYLSSLIF